MKDPSITAMISAFSRAYHSQNNDIHVFNDYIAKKLLSDEEYQKIAGFMTNGRQYFNPSSTSTQENTLRWIVDQKLSPTPLGRAAFTEKALETATLIGVKQYLIFAAGYDSFAYRQAKWAKSLYIFELDHPATSQDKQMRLERGEIHIPPNISYIQVDFSEENWSLSLTQNHKFKQNQMSFCSFLGLSYYLQKNIFQKTLLSLAPLLPKGSSVVFDYQSNDKDSVQTKQIQQLAQGAAEPMLASYSFREIEQLLCECGFLIYEHLTPPEITKQFFATYNKHNPNHTMQGADNVNYCLAVKK